MTEDQSTIISDQAKWLDKVTALLNKAESTEFPEEAEALTSKAAEMMAKYAIDEMMVQFNKDGKDIKEEVLVVSYEVKMPYARDRMHLLYAIAKSMACDMYYIPVHRNPRGFGAKMKKSHHLESRIVGFKSDVDRVITMYESLVKQETVARAFAVKNDPWLAGGSMGEKKIFSASFIRGFAIEAGRRIKEAYKKAEAAGNGTVALAVRSRDQKVADKMSTQGVRQRKSGQRSSFAGGAAGRQAGRNATISKAVGR